MDGIFGIGPLELILIAVIALIVLGPERLPGVMREGARYIREIRKMGSELTSQFSDELKVLDELNPRKMINDALDPNYKDPAQVAKEAAAAKAADAKPQTRKPPQRRNRSRPRPLQSRAQRPRLARSRPRQQRVLRAVPQPRTHPPLRPHRKAALRRQVRTEPATAAARMPTLPKVAPLRVRATA